LTERGARGAGGVRQPIDDFRRDLFFADQNHREDDQRREADQQQDDHQADQTARDTARAGAAGTSDAHWLAPSCSPPGQNQQSAGDITTAIGALSYPSSLSRLAQPGFRRFRRAWGTT